MTDGTNDDGMSLQMCRVEAAGMATLTQALLDRDMVLAWDVAKLLRYLSIV
uniref:Uncharacterized protein n=1 Tax=uncultured prokaryote TaxID=198431 RepID=A0A0H5Q4E8_9ZZZZ|nr:hypothetical protein [uncultured prokaryote]